MTHYLRGRSLLLTNLSGTGKTHVARRIVAQLREAGDVDGSEPGPRSAPGAALGAERPL